MRATEVERPEKTLIHSRPVVIQGIQQRTLRILTAECDAIINGVTLRLPPGCAIAINGGGSGGAVGSLMCDLTFTGRDGLDYRASKGMQIRIPYHTEG